MKIIDMVYERTSNEEIIKKIVSQLFCPNDFGIYVNTNCDGDNDCKKCWDQEIIK